MATCPTCRARYADGTTTCPADGEHLLPDQVFASTDADLEPGQRVGEYCIEEKIGQGGFGTVYRGVHPLIGKTAAIKVLNRQYSHNPQMVARFISEARAVNKIQSRYIIDIFSFGAIDDGRHYYVMELLQGMTLDQHLRQRGRLTPEQAIPILRGVARALDAAHAAGIAHRDLKPENIFLVIDKDGTTSPKLLDFGIAKLLSDMPASHKTRTGQPIGTPAYMSPEQCRGRDVDHRTDIYSLGVVTYELLTGRLPFVGEAVMDLLVKHTSVEPPPPSHVCAELPPVLDAPILRLLAKDPATRPTPAEAGVDELARAAAAAGLAVDPSAPSKPALHSSPSGAKPLVHAMTPRDVRELSEAQTLPVGAPDATLPAGAAQTRTLLNAEAEVSRPRNRHAALLAAVSAAIGALAAALFVMGGPTEARDVPGAAPPPEAALPAKAPEPAPPPSASVPQPEAASAPQPEVERAQTAPATEDVEITIQATPKDVDVYAGDAKLGTSAAPLRLPRGDAPVKLLLKARGYVPAEITITPSANGVVSATLNRLPSTPARSRKPEVEF